MSLVSAIPQTIKQIGRTEASGQAARGQWGQSIASIGQMVGQMPQRAADRRLQSQREEANNLNLSASRRNAAADEAMQNAMQQAVQPDGSIDQAKLTALLAGTPAASKLPQILAGLNQLQQTTLQLRTAKITAQDAEDDAIGKIAHSARVVDDPETQAGLLLTGIAAGVKGGVIQADRGKTLIAELLGEDGTSPDPAKVTATLDRLTAGSNEQRRLSVSDAQKKAATENALALADYRQATTEARKTQSGLANFGSQLGRATTAERYARIYAGVPAQLRGYFDAPEDFDPEVSPERARSVLMTPAQQETERHNRSLESAAAAVRAETTRHNREMEKKGAGGKSADDPTYDRDFAEYKLWLDQWAEVQKRKIPPVDEQGYPLQDMSGREVAPEYDAPPPFDEWRRLDKGKRVGVGQVGDVDLAPASSAKKPTAVTPPATGGKTITTSELKAAAKVLNISEAEARDGYIQRGYTVLK